MNEFLLNFHYTSSVINNRYDMMEFSFIRVQILASYERVMHRNKLYKICLKKKFRIIIQLLLFNLFKKNFRKDFNSHGDFFSFSKFPNESSKLRLLDFEDRNIGREEGKPNAGNVESKCGT